MDIQGLNDIRPLKDLVEIQREASLFFIVILVLLITVIVFSVLYFKKKSKMSVNTQESLPGLSPEEIAMSRLEGLVGMDLVRKGLIKQYYVSLSEIMRGYLQGRYNIYAQDMTTMEIYQDMRNKRMKLEKSSKIRDFLEDCDMVKFAKYVPSNKETEKILDEARGIIEVSSIPPGRTEKNQNSI